MVWDPTQPATEALLLSAPVRENFQALNALMQGPGGTPFPLLATNGSVTAPSYSFVDQPGIGFFKTGGVLTLAGGGSQALSLGYNADIVGVALRSDGHLAWSPDGTTAGGATDLKLLRGGAGFLHQRNGTNPQKFSLYETSGVGGDSALAFEALSTMRITSQQSGGAPARALLIGTEGNAPLQFLVNAAVRWYLDTDGFLYPATNNTVDIGGTTLQVNDLYLGGGVKLNQGRVILTTAGADPNLGFGAYDQRGGLLSAASSGATDTSLGLLTPTGSHTFTAFVSSAITNLVCSHPAIVLTPQGTLAGSFSLRIGAITVPASGVGLLVTDNVTTLSPALAAGAKAGLYLPVHVSTPPGTPPTGYVSLYAKSDKQFYQKDDAGLETGLASLGFLNPMTAPSDLIVGGTAGAALRLPKGTETQTLTIFGGAVAWRTPGTDVSVVGEVNLPIGEIFPDGTGSNNAPPLIYRNQSGGTQTSNTPKVGDIIAQFSGTVFEVLMASWVLPPDYWSGGALVIKFSGGSTTGNMRVRGGVSVFTDQTLPDVWSAVFVASDTIDNIAMPTAGLHRQGGGPPLDDGGRRGGEEGDLLHPPRGGLGQQRTRATATSTRGASGTPRGRSRREVAQQVPPGWHHGLRRRQEAPRGRRLQGEEAQAQEGRGREPAPLPARRGPRAVVQLPG